MSTEQPAVSAEQLQRAVEVLAAHPNADHLCALGYDVLSRQAEGRGLFAGEKFAQQRAEAHAVVRADADTALGNVLTLIERGPETPSEHALLAALFVRGFGAALGREPEKRPERRARFAEHCEWLELRTPYRVLPLVERLLAPEAVAAVYGQLADRVLFTRAKVGDAQSRSLQAGRIALLAQSNGETAREALERISSGAQDPFVALLAAHALGRAGGPVALGGVPTLRGPLGRAQRSVLGSVVRAFTGLTLATLCVRVLLRIAGLRREVELSLRGPAVSVQRRTWWFGRELRSEAQVRNIGLLRSARRSARFAGLHATLGTAGFALGVLLAGKLALDAAATGDAVLWLAAAGLALAGSLLDVLVSVVLPGRRGSVTLEVDLGRGARGRVSGIALQDADAFLAALTAELERTAKGAARGVA